MMGKMGLFLCVLLLILTSEATSKLKRETSDDVNKRDNVADKPVQSDQTDKSDASEQENFDTNQPTVQTTEKSINNTTENGTSSTTSDGIFKTMLDNKDMLMRTFYVLLGVTSIVIIYFGVRAWRWMEVKIIENEILHEYTMDMYLSTHGKAQTFMEPDIKSLLNHFQREVLISLNLQECLHRLRRRRNKSRKYGLITTPGSDLEMEPLDRDMDEDDDMTVFEVNGRHK